MSANPTQIKLVILDWAGTVLDFGCRAPAGAFVAAFAEVGVTVSVAEARRPMGLHKKDHIREMRTRQGNTQIAIARAQHAHLWVIFHNLLDQHEVGRIIFHIQQGTL